MRFYFKCFARLELVPCWHTTVRVTDICHDLFAIIKHNVIQASLSSILRRELETDPESGFETPDCSESQLTNFNSAAQCGALSNRDGPFAACHATLPPKTYQEWVIYAERK